jgi:hypothetical protein
VADNLTIDAGTIDTTPIGQSTPSTGVFSNATATNLAVVTAADLQGTLSVTGDTLLANATAANLAVTTQATISALIVSGQTTLANASITNLTVSGTSDFQGTTTITGHLLPGADNQYDIGATSSPRWRSGYFGTSVEVGSSTIISDNDIEFTQVGTITLANLQNALNIDSNTLAIDALNNRVGIGTTTSTGIFAVATSTGASVFHIDESRYIGIGTTTPAARLHIVAGGSSVPYLKLSNTTGSDDSRIAFEEDYQGENFYINYNGGDNMLEFGVV